MILGNFCQTKTSKSAKHNSPPGELAPAFCTKLCTSFAACQIFFAESFSIFGKNGTISFGLRNELLAQGLDCSVQIPTWFLQSNSMEKHGTQWYPLDKFIPIANLWLCFHRKENTILYNNNIIFASTLMKWRNYFWPLISSRKHQFTEIVITIAAIEL